jgi:NAD(P)-dependent dehydrogenase (short-subunit alcohol dehydrogenase family)/acyl dehydratase/putative sterol carrier protein
MGLLDGKVAIITGAGGGLGRTHALLLAKEGARIVVNDLGGTMDGSGSGSAMADQVVAEIVAMGGEAVANYASVADEAGAQSMVNDAINAWGRLDILVNNAGILRDKSLLKLEPPHFDLVLQVHARGTYLCTRAAAAKMKELGNGGAIISTSSIAGLKGNFGQTNYACAKAGIAGMTRVWAMELGRAGIRCNVIAPMAKTRMTVDIDAVPEDIKPEQISPMVLFLASDLAKDVNGRIFGCHGKHMFEYRMALTPGVVLEGEDWTAASISERLEEISQLEHEASGAAPAASSDASDGDKLNEIFRRMPEAFLPEKAGDWAADIHFDIGGTGSWTVSIADGRCTTAAGAPADASCNIKYKSAEIMIGVATRTINPQQAFMSGKISADNMGDLMKFAQCFDMSKAGKTAPAASSDASDGDKLNEIFRRMPEAFLPEKAGDWAADIHFDIGGTGSWTVSIADGRCTTAAGAPADASCNIKYKSAEIMIGVATRTINPQQAFMSGKISADNMGDLMKFAQCFDMSKAKETAPAAEVAADAPDKAAGMNKATIGKRFRGPSEFVYPEHIEAFAQATNDDNPRYVGSDEGMAPVIFPVRPLLGVCGQAALDKELNADLMRLVHGEQEMIFHSALKPWDLITARAEITDIQDKASGQLLKISQRLMRDGECVVEATSGYFIRGPGGGGSKSDKTAPPERDYLFEQTWKMDEDQSIRYAEASLDKNPIHTDEGVAKAAGHPRVIAHGLCTLAMSTRELINQVAGKDPTKLKRIRVRFTKIVLPGDTLHTRAWLIDQTADRKTIGFETLNTDGQVVLGNASAEFVR